MSTETIVGSPSRGRRSRTTIATAGAVLLALCLALLSPLGATKAFAIDDARDVTWDISDGRAGYQQMIKDVRGRVEGQAIYGNGSPGTVYATERSADYFIVNVFDGPNLLTRLVLNAQNLYVQGYYNPNDSTYRHTSDAQLQDVNWVPSSSGAPPVALALPFAGIYAGNDNGHPGLTNFANQNRQGPVFSTDWARANAQALSDTNSSDQIRARALLWFVEAVAEGARFNAISDRITAAWGDSWGYKFDDSDEGLITNWQAIGNNLQQRLQGTGVGPTPAIGRYHFDTLQSTAAVIVLALWWSRI